MGKRIFAFSAALMICLGLFGCGKTPQEPDPQNTVSTTTLPPETEDSLLPKDGYYIFQSTVTEFDCYLHLESLSGTLYMMNVPTQVTLLDDKITWLDPEGLECSYDYTYKNEKLSFDTEELKFVLKYVGEELPQKYMPVLPPAGSYMVSSVSVNGDMLIYGEETEDLLTISEDGTGSFYFAKNQHAVQLTEDSLLIDGKPMPFSYYPEGGDSPILLLLWMNEDADSIALRPVEE
ncbi:MAG: hypothetical protein IJY91_06795 [Oscillospiraceae bacterium]|nr:hypothetical protein [Oscillospiraceae bacterium]